MERYTKVRNIGKGNMGACFLMRHNDDHKYYVIKQIDLAKMSKKERQQALNEARVLSALKHPNIINYVDSFLAKRSDHLCIVMEYAEGGDIAQRIKGCRGRHMREEQILDWFIQTCLATNAIHHKHILHRDIKTQNVFLTSQSVVKLGDFGIARVLQNTFDQAHTFVGTPYYLSPELVQEKPYDSRSDTWALGVVLYEMMALRHPFNANDMKSLMTKIIRVQYEPPPSFYSQELREVVARTLVRDPRQRMTLGDMLSAPIVGRRISQWVAGSSGVAQGYIQNMLQHRLLPGFTQITDSAPRQSDVQQHLPQISERSGARRGGGGGGGDGVYEHERRRNREDIRREFSELRAHAAPAPASVHRTPAPPQQQARRDHDESTAGVPSHDHYARDHYAGAWDAEWPHAPSAGRRAGGEQQQRVDPLRQRELQKERELQGMMGDRGGHARHPQLARLGGQAPPWQLPVQQHAPRPAHLPRMALPSGIAQPVRGALPSAAPSHYSPSPVGPPPRVDSGLREARMPPRLPPQQLSRQQQGHLPMLPATRDIAGGGLPPVPRPRPLAPPVALPNGYSRV